MLGVQIRYSFIGTHAAQAGGTAIPYDQLLAERAPRDLEDRTDMVEKAMFGGLAFMVSGNMCCGVNRDDLIVRLDARTIAEQLFEHQ